MSMGHPHIELPSRRLSLSQPLAFVDLETTGSILGLDRIIEVGVVKVSPQWIESEFQTRINPEMAITTEATRKHGITDRDVANESTFGTIADRLAEFLRGCNLAGYNILNFDLPMLLAEFQRVRRPLEMENRRIID